MAFAYWLIDEVGIATVPGSSFYTADAQLFSAPRALPNKNKNGPQRGTKSARNLSTVTIPHFPLCFLCLFVAHFSFVGHVAS